MSDKIDDDYVQGLVDPVQDLLLERDELRAEVERLTGFVAEMQPELGKLKTEVEQWRTDWLAVQTENERLRAALLRLVELDHDDGSAPETAWKDAFEHAETLVSD